MDDGNTTGDAWARLLQEIIASWRLVFRVVVLLLACTPAVVAAVFILFMSR